MPLDPSAYTRIKFVRHGRILEVSLSNPAKMNAVDGPMHHELARVFTDIAHDKDSDVVILTGEGKAFCAGGDIEWMRRSREGQDEGPGMEEGKAIIFSLLELEKPIVAKVRGPAVGLGATLALFCDVIFASDTARFSDPHVKVGIVAGDGGTVIWPALVGFARAKEYLMTGDPVPAREAERIGLVNHVLDDADLDAQVMAFAERLAKGATLAIRYTKVGVNLELKRLAHSLLDAAMAYEMTTFATADHREAVAAFLEKRKPNFTGR
jgi:enoyl-CoA hydratase